MTHYLSFSKRPVRGFFAGKDIAANSSIGYGDVAIHTFHLMANQIYSDPKTDELVENLDKNPLANMVDWFEQYVWVRYRKKRNGSSRVLHTIMF
jgi:hypothetical protein